MVEVCLIVLMLLFVTILIICLLNLASSEYDFSKDKEKTGRYFIDVDYRNSLFYEEKDEHHN